MEEIIKSVSDLNFNHALVQTVMCMFVQIIEDTKNTHMEI